MTRTNIIPPRVGPATIVMVAIGMIGIGSLVAPEMSPPTAELEPAIVKRNTVIGLYYGIVAWFCWLATVVPNRFVRFALRVLTAMIGSYVIQKRLYDPIHLDTGYVIRYAINFGGMMISQSAIFHLLQVPPWRIGGAQGDDRQERLSIADLLIFTSCIAVMFSLAVRYQPPVDRLLYWPWLLGIWAVFPVTTAAICIAALEPRVPRAAIALVIAIGVTACGALLIGTQESHALQPKIPVRIWAIYYGAIGIGNLLVIAGFSVAGRIDAAIDSRAAANHSDSAEAEAQDGQ